MRSAWQGGGAGVWSAAGSGAERMRGSTRGWWPVAGGRQRLPSPCPSPSPRPAFRDALNDVAPQPATRNSFSPLGYTVDGCAILRHEVLPGRALHGGECDGIVGRERPVDQGRIIVEEGEEVREIRPPVGR